jgi:cell division protein FtsQ
MYAKRKSVGSAVLETPERTFVPEQGMPRRAAAAPRRKLRLNTDRDFEDDFADDFEGDGGGVRRGRGQLLKVKWYGLPTTMWGRIAAGSGLVVVLGLCVAMAMGVRGWLLHDERFVIPASSAIEIEGNRHLSRAQLLSIFGEDVERNIFTISLTARQAELEQLPWVAHATVMRLLPDHLRVSIVERTPVAFVRQGGRIGLVDAGGVLLDMPADVRDTTHYSFPVVTGIRGEDPLSTRAARMKLYRGFTTDLDSGGEKISEQLSEIDLSNPEDVKALIPDKPADILVHFGDTDFLERYHKYEAHLAEWRTQYPKLASVDMRYERQVVLEMQPGASTDAASGSGVKAVEAKAPVAAAKAPVKAAAVKSAAVKAPAKAVVHPVALKADTKSVAAPVKGVVAAPVAPVVVAAKPAVVAPAPAAAKPGEAVSHWVAPAKVAPGKAVAAKGKVVHPAVKKPHVVVKKKVVAKTVAAVKKPVKQGVQVPR